MDIIQLQYFKVVAETGSLTKAAKLLHISQPAMSTMLKKFEEDLDVELFDRSPNRIKLNQAGEIALIHANTILQSIEQMKTDLKDYASQNQSISMGFCDPGIQFFCFPRFSSAYPDIQITRSLYDEEDYVKPLLERIYDVIITPDKINHPGIISMPFIKDTVYLSVPSGNNLLENPTVSLTDIPEQPLLYPQIGGYFLKQIEKVIQSKNLPITLVKNDYIITQHLIRTTNFLATTSTLAIELRNDGSHRKILPFRDPELNVTYHITYLKSNKEKVRKFLTWAKESEEVKQLS